MLQPRTYTPKQTAEILQLSKNTIYGLIGKGEIKDEDMRFFLGYAGWSPNQLENELSEHAWIVTELDCKTIMADPDLNLWQDTLEGLDGKYRTWINFPENPSLN